MKDVKHALGAAREAKDQVLMLKAQLSAAINSNAEKKAELYSEVMTRDAKSVPGRTTCQGLAWRSFVVMKSSKELG